LHELFQSISNNICTLIFSCPFQHCDAKPDNWVITSTSSNNCKKFETDLELVDFGRAIDLDKLGKKNYNMNNGSTWTWMDTVFIGNATTEEMKCVSMRLGLPWSFEIDTFGICACVHTLIHGIHIEIEKITLANGMKRWMPKRQFPRHFEKELWVEAFDTLLNLDEDFGRAIGSRPYNVKRLRKRIENYLHSDNNDDLLDAAFTYQASILPNKRP
jgi:checkpoint serine/threonine-protein kinase